jgi:Xaa-Pro aminopeptidase
MVVTVEPGVYVPGLASVRIENSIAVCPDRPEPFNRLTTELIRSRECGEVAR